eukprot:1192042-Prorocentrum_minimum.AAC.5
MHSRSLNRRAGLLHEGASLDEGLHATQFSLEKARREVEKRMLFELGSTMEVCNQKVGTAQFGFVQSGITQHVC